jgi:HSP90 family molecular chaperone
MTQTINAFYKNNEFFLRKPIKSFSDMYAIKLDMNHLKMQRCFENKKKHKIDVLSDKENKRISITDTRI